MNSFLGRYALLGCLVFGFAGPAFAEPAHQHNDGPGPHGGRIEDAGRWHAELVTSGDTVSVYLSDRSGKPLPAAEFSGTAIIVAAGKSTRIPLAPEGDKLTGKAAMPLGDRPKGAVRLSGPGGASASAQFQ